MPHRLTRREFIGSAVATTALAASAGLQGAPARRPNVLFILADDLGYGDLSCYGRPDYQTPVLDRLARQGLMFTSNYAAAPVCTPTRCAYITGRGGGGGRDQRSLLAARSRGRPDDGRPDDDVGWTPGDRGGRAGPRHRDRHPGRNRRLDAAVALTRPAARGTNAAGQRASQTRRDSRAGGCRSAAGRAA